MKLKGKLTISAPSGRNYDLVHIRVEDESSGVSFLEVTLPKDAFADALFSRNVDCTFTLQGVQNVGKVYEHKTVLVPCEMRRFTAEEARAMLAPYEVDGWKGRADDLNNHHHRKNGGFEVTCWRFVDAPDVAQGE